MLNACSDSSHSRGVAILFKENIDCNVTSREVDDMVRKNISYFLYYNEILDVLSIFTPNMELLHIEF